MKSQHANLITFYYPKLKHIDIYYMGDLYILVRFCY